MSAAVAHASITPRRYRFSVEQFYRMAEAGILAPNERVELVDGAIVTLAPPGPLQASVIADLTRLAIERTSDAVRVGVHNPIHLDRHTEPRPALCLSRYHPGRDAHPVAEDTYFVVEVSDTTLDYDRDTKLPLYAAAGIPEAWLFDVKARLLERHTDPRDGIYQQIARAGRGQSLAPPPSPPSPSPWTTCSADAAVSRQAESPVRDRRGPAGLL